MPGLCICLAVGGLVYVLAPVLYAIAFGLSGRVKVARPRVRAAFAIGSVFLGLVAVIATLTNDFGFGEWWATVGAWSLVACWALLLTTLVLVYRALRAGERPGAGLPIELGMSGAARPRTLAEALRTLPAADLRRLLQERADLVRPAPHRPDRAGQPGHHHELRDPCPGAPRRLARDRGRRAGRPARSGRRRPPWPSCWTSPLPLVAAAVDELRALGLVWGDADRLHLVRPAREAFEPFPGGLAPPSPRPLPDAQIDAALARCGPAARTVLDRLLWSPTGKVRNADRTAPWTPAGRREPAHPRRWTSCWPWSCSGRWTPTR